MCRKNQRKFQTTYYEADDIHKQFLVKLYLFNINNLLLLTLI